MQLFISTFRVSKLFHGFLGLKDEKNAFQNDKKMIFDHFRVFFENLVSPLKFANQSFLLHENLTNLVQYYTSVQKKYFLALKKGYK